MKKASSSTSRKRRAAREVWGNYRRNAAKRGHPFALTPANFSALIFQPCHYCGAAPGNRLGRLAITYSGLDRTDNSRGYELGNVVPCCRTCNELKRAVPLPIWTRWLRALTRHQVTLALQGDPSA